VADTLWAVSHGKCFETRFSELLHPKPEETRTPEEVIADIKNKLREVHTDECI